MIRDTSSKGYGCQYIEQDKTEKFPRRAPIKWNCMKLFLVQDQIKLVNSLQDV